MKEAPGYSFCCVKENPDSCICVNMTVKTTSAEKETRRELLTLDN